MPNLSENIYLPSTAFYQFADLNRMLLEAHDDPDLVKEYLGSDSFDWSTVVQNMDENEFPEIMIGLTHEQGHLLRTKLDVSTSILHDEAIFRLIALEKNNPNTELQTDFISTAENSRKDIAHANEQSAEFYALDMLCTCL